VTTLTARKSSAKLWQRLQKQPAKLWRPLNE
jgi:hypothetical protein